eukprot:gb/GECG01009466.1/.p1 GENE.gb/GECG01009466.1/~~gb/GECG01009466.1/.p1  ORF type:complete len:109 (+),score=11.23 gb/GECG01009466.1/:1-327(+)
MPLTQDEIDGCRDAFLAYDKDRNGCIEVWELKEVLEAMGQKPTEEELFQMISEVDENASGTIGTSFPLLFYVCGTADPVFVGENILYHHMQCRFWRVFKGNRKTKGTS